MMADKNTKMLFTTTCDECKGTGEHGRCICTGCGNEHGEVCQKCGGDGEIFIRKQKKEHKL